MAMSLKNFRDWQASAGGFKAEDYQSQADGKLLVREEAEEAGGRSSAVMAAFGR